MRLHGARLPALVTIAVLTATAVLPLAAGADSSSEGAFVSDTNSARSDHGLRAYAVSGDLTSVARRWAAHMAATRTLAHNPNYGSEVCCWTQIGENVGEGQSVSQIQRAFMNSPEHRANILSTSFTQVGIGTARSSDGRLWVDEIFRRPTSAAPRTVHHPSHTTVVRHPAVRSAPPRASRSELRRPRHVIRTPRASALAVFLRRLARARAVVAASYADPVGGTFGYVQLMRTIAG